MYMILFVGFSPEAFIHILFGHLMDRMGNDAPRSYSSSWAHRSSWAPCS